MEYLANSCPDVVKSLRGYVAPQVLARYVQYLKTENRILRCKLPARVTVTPQERQRLLKFGKPLGKAIHELISIVTPRTFARWLSGETSAHKGGKPAKPGRPRTAEEIRQLVLRLARETGWGYTRILGELKKLGVAKISRATVLNILREHGLEPGPKRGEGTWDEFLKRHAATLWACDFFSKKVWTVRGLVDVFVLFFLHVGTRRVHVAGISAQPDRAWVTQQARNVSMFFAEQPDPPRSCCWTMTPSSSGSSTRSWKGTASRSSAWGRGRPT